MSSVRNRVRVVACAVAIAVMTLFITTSIPISAAQQAGAAPKAQEVDPAVARAERDLERLGEEATRSQAAKALKDAMTNVENADVPVAPDDPAALDLRDAIVYYLRANGQHMTPEEVLDEMGILWGSAGSDLGLGSAEATNTFERLKNEGRYGSEPWRLVFALAKLRDLRAARAANTPKPAGTVISGSLHVRERASGEESLLATVTAGESPIGRINFRLPSSYDLSLASAPSNWTLVQKGRDLSVSGPARQRVDLRFDTRRGSGMIQRLMRQGGEKIEFEIANAGGNPFRTALTVSVLPKVSVVDVLDGAITVPSQVTPGTLLYATPAPNFTAGSWRLLGPDGWLDFQPLNLRTLTDTPATTAGGPVATDVERTLTLALRHFRRATPGAVVAPPRLSYHDQWNEELINGVAGWTEMAPEDCPLRLSGGAAMAFAGQDACVAGCFPHFGVAAQFLTLDGQRLLAPLAASATTIRLRIPDDVTPGPHVIEWHRSTGLAGQSLAVNVLQLQGSIDQNELWKGQATTMRLNILGSQQPIALKVVNETPTVIDVEGGVRQRVTTAGGADNATTRSVRGIMRGNFNITYSLDQAACGVPGSR